MSSGRSIMGPFIIYLRGKLEHIFKTFVFGLDFSAINLKHAIAVLPYSGVRCGYFASCDRYSLCG